MCQAPGSNRVTPLVIAPAGADSAQVAGIVSQDHDVWPIDPGRDAELVRRVYARSWPLTCRADFSADAVITRLGERDLVWWQQVLSRAPVRFACGPADGGFGFVTVAPVTNGWDLTYLVCEPEAFGTGLAASLHAAALGALEPSAPLGAWILAGDARSQASFTRLGWRNCGRRQPPWPSAAEFYRFERVVPEAPCE